MDSARTTPWLYRIVLPALLAFWAATVAGVVVASGLALRPDERAPTGGASVRMTETGLPSITPIPRPAAVPSAAEFVASDVTLGDATPPVTSPFAARDNFYALRCRDDLLTVATTKEIVYAQVSCGRYWLADEVVRPFLAQPVIIRIVQGSVVLVTFTATAGGTARFDAQAVWIRPLNAQ